MADEGAFLELLVANERVGKLVDVLADPSQRQRHKAAIMQLQQEVQRGSTYVEEAARLGVIQVLTNLLARTTDERVMDAVSRVISLCSGPMACGGKISTFYYDGVTAHIREGALGDGLGAKVWSVCHILCRELVSHPEIVAGHKVLEIGSGTGLCGIVAAKVGAEQVLLTDHEPQVLLNLRTCMHLNTSQPQPQQQAAEEAAHQASASPAAAAAAAAAAVPSSGSGAVSHALEDFLEEEDQPCTSSGAAAAAGASSGLPPAARGGAGGVQAGLGGSGAAAFAFTDEELFDEAEEVEDFDLGALLSPRGGTSSSSSRPGQRPSMELAAAAAAAAGISSWEAGNMAVRCLDWCESRDAMDGPAEAGVAAASGNASSSTENAQQQQQREEAADAAPTVPIQERFAMILGNEVMYEPAHAVLVASAVAHRLAPGGRALLCCAVRDCAVFATFRDSCRQRGLRYRAVRVAPEDVRDTGGIKGRERDYEGGYLLMAVDHEGSPAADWHRDDFQLVE